MVTPTKYGNKEDTVMKSRIKQITALGMIILLTLTGLGFYAFADDLDNLDNTDDEIIEAIPAEEPTTDIEEPELLEPEEPEEPEVPEDPADPDPADPDPADPDPADPDPADPDPANPEPPVLLGANPEPDNSNIIRASDLQLDPASVTYDGNEHIPTLVCLREDVPEFVVGNQYDLQWDYENIEHPFTDVGIYTAHIDIYGEYESETGDPIVLTFEIKEVPIINIGSCTVTIKDVDGNNLNRNPLVGEVLTMNINTDASPLYYYWTYSENASLHDNRDYSNPDVSYTCEVFTPQINGWYTTGTQYTVRSEDIGKHLIAIVVQGRPVNEYGQIDYQVTFSHSAATYPVSDAPMAVATVAPQIVSGWTYDGGYHDLLIRGESDLGTMCYFVTEEYGYTPELGDFVQYTPFVRNAGTYYVWWMIWSRNSDYEDMPPERLGTVVVRQKKITITAKDRYFSQEVANSGLNIVDNDVSRVICQGLVDKHYLSQITTTVSGGSIIPSAAIITDYSKDDYTSCYDIQYVSGEVIEGIDFVVSAGSFDVEGLEAPYGTVEIVSGEHADGKYQAGDKIKLKLTPKDGFDLLCTTLNAPNGSLEMDKVSLLQNMVTYVGSEGAYYYEYTMPDENADLKVYFMPGYIRVIPERVKVYDTNTDKELTSAPCPGDKLAIIPEVTYNFDENTDNYMLYYKWVDAAELEQLVARGYEYDFNKDGYYRYKVEDGVYEVKESDIGNKLYLIVIQSFEELNLYAVKEFPAVVRERTQGNNQEQKDNSSGGGSSGGGKSTTSPTVTPTPTPAPKSSEDDADEKEKPQNPIQKVIDKIINRGGDDTVEEPSDEELFDTEGMQYVDAETSTEPVAVEDNKPVTLKYGDGTVEIAMANSSSGSGGGAFNAGIVDAKAAIEAILSDELLAMVESGSKVKIKVRTTPLTSDSITDDEKDLIDKGVKELRESMPNLKKAESIDISLMVKFDHDEWDYITTTRKPIEITVSIPDDDKGLSENYYILRVHGTDTTLLEDTDNNEDTITIGSDRFSTYTILYDKIETYNGADNEKSSVIPLSRIKLGWLAVCLSLLFVYLNDRHEINVKRRASLRKALNHSHIL